MSAWVVLACIAGISLTYVFRVLFARWYYRQRIANLQCNFGGADYVHYNPESGHCGLLS